MENVKKYRVELDAEKHPILCEEAEYLYFKELNSTENIVSLCNSIYHLEHAAEEHVVMLAVNLKGKALGLFEVSHGSVSHSFCNAREIYMRALLVGASAIFLIHNHPSGEPDFSESDQKCSRHLKNAGQIVGINLLDFIVIGDNSRYVSEAEIKRTDLYTV